MAKFKRIVRVAFPSIGMTIPQELKVSFVIDKNNTGTPNTATINIYNLSPSTREQLNAASATIEISAGHEEENNVGLIFHGNVSSVVHEQDGRNVVTTIECGDGARAVKRGFVSKTFPKGTSVEALVWDMVNDTSLPGVALGDTVGLADAGSLDRPWTFMKPTKECLDELGRTYGFHWSVQNGALEVVEKTSAIDDTVYLSNTSGLIGTPATTEKGISFTALLHPDLRPNRLAQLNTPNMKRDGTSGLYRIEAVITRGDNWDGDFITQCECVPVVAGAAEEREYMQ